MNPQVYGHHSSGQTTTQRDKNKPHVQPPRIRRSWAWVKPVSLILLIFLEGWMTCFTLTHDRLPSPLGTGTPQWMITLALVFVVVIPFVWLAIINIDTDE